MTKMSDRVKVARESEQYIADRAEKQRDFVLDRLASAAQFASEHYTTSDPAHVADALRSNLESLLRDVQDLNAAAVKADTLREVMNYIETESTS